jgi:hypothetical protein
VAAASDSRSIRSQLLRDAAMGPPSVAASNGGRAPSPLAPLVPFPPHLLPQRARRRPQLATSIPATSRPYRSSAPRKPRRPSRAALRNVVPPVSNLLGCHGARNASAEMTLAAPPPRTFPAQAWLFPKPNATYLARATVSLCFLCSLCSSSLMLNFTPSFQYLWRWI